MGIRPHRLARLRSDESGFTLIELLVASSMLAMVLVAVLSLGETAARLVPQETERGAVITESGAGLYQMTRELRGASSGTCGSSITVSAYRFSGCVTANGTVRLVTYDCTVAVSGQPTWTRCSRTAGGQTRVVIDRVLNVGLGQPVFTCEPTNCVSPVFVQAAIRVPAKGNLRIGHTGTIAYSDGFALRNNGA